MITQSELDAATIPAEMAVTAHTGLVPLAVAQQLMRERDRKNTLAKEAYEAWWTDQDSRVGKLLLALTDEVFARQYRPDLFAAPTTESAAAAMNSEANADASTEMSKSHNAVSQQDQTQSRLNDAAAHGK